MVKAGRKKKIIGRREPVDFPDLGLYGLTAKIDTGAYTSALHCQKVRVEGDKLYFRLLDETHPEYNDREYCFTDFIRKSFKNSFGEQEDRYVVKTRIRLGSKTILCHISLSDRAGMRYPVLIGRRLIKGRFLVDVSELFTLVH